MPHFVSRHGALILLVLHGVAVGAETTGPSDTLTSYLRRSKPHPEERAAALAVVEDAQIITLHYERDTPTASPAENAEFARSLKASHVTPIDHHKDGKIHPQISAVFSTLFNPQLTEPEDWLPQMRRPIEAGYELKSVSVVLTPPQSVKRESFRTSQNVVRALARELEEMKADFSQLQGFKATNLRMGGWKHGDDWPEYPVLGYEHAVGPDKKANRETYADDWCDVSFGIHPISGNPRARVVSARQYPMQGIEVSWDARSGDERFNKEFSRVVVNSLKELDALEAELRQAKLENGSAGRAAKIGTPLTRD